MSSLTRADVRRIATLARLQLSDDELDTYARQLNGILEYAESIQAIDTTDVPPYGGTLPAEHLRADEIVASLSREDALRNAPGADLAAGTFVVPKVIG